MMIKSKTNMLAYYNEIDPYAAQWLRNLISKGLIAPGDVDERSIEDVHPSDLKNYAQCHFFAGIGIWSYALRRAGWPDDKPVWTGSCPCQPFSSAGKGAGFADERHLWPAWNYLIDECRPAIVFGEQVASKDAEPWIDLVSDDLETLGYAVGAIPFPAASVGSPQIRDRLYWVADAHRYGSQGWLRGRSDSQRQAVNGPTGPGSAVVGVAYHNGERLGASGRRCAEHENTEQRRRLGGLADTDGPRSFPSPYTGIHSREDGAGSRYGEPERPGSVGGLEHTSSIGRHRREASAPGHHDDGHAPVRSQGDHGFGVSSAHRVHQHSASPTDGFWRAADWLLCRDGKWRPVEPGTFPLAHGATARVGRLRAYGNAIVAPQAQVFIETVMDWLGYGDL